MGYLSSNPKFLYLALIIILGSSVYLNAIPNDFVWDDGRQVVGNLFIHDWRNLPLFFASSTFYTGEATLSGVFYRPFVSVSYLLNYSIFGSKSFGFHLFQIFFHLLNSILIFFIISRIFSLENVKYSQEIAFLSAILFTVHPANVESVTFIGSVGEILYTFFGLGSLLILFFSLDWQKRVIKNKLLILSFFLVFLSLLSKETGAVVFLVSFLYLLIFFKPKLKQYFKWFLGAAGTLGAYFILRFAVAKIPVTESVLTKVSFFERVLTAPYEIFRYFQTIFFPLHLSIFQYFVVSSPKDLRFWGSSLLLIFILFTAGFFIWKKKSKIQTFFLLWFFVCLTPVLNIFPLGGVTIAERWLYFPIIGILASVSFPLVKILKKINDRKKIIVYSVLGALIIILGTRTVIRNSDWKNNLTLYGHDIQYTNQNFGLENDYGMTLIQIGEYEEAERHLKKAIELWSQNPHPYAGLGMLYAATGDIEKAVEYYNKSIERGDIYGVYENLGGIMVQQKRWKEAEDFLNKAIEKFPKDANLKWLLSLVYRQKGQVKQAEFLLEKALENDPQNKEVIHDLQLIKEEKF